MTSGRGKDRSDRERTNCINATRTDCGTVKTGAGEGLYHAGSSSGRRLPDRSPSPAAKRRRRQHSAHGALSYLRDQCLKLGINWIIDADIAKFFDTIEPTHLRTILQRRVNDGAILRLIGMWLHVGVLEEGKVVRSEKGTPQGGVISPILANIFVCTLLAEWFESRVRARMGGNCFLV